MPTWSLRENFRYQEKKKKFFIKITSLHFKLWQSPPRKECLEKLDRDLYIFELVNLIDLSFIARLSNRPYFETRDERHAAYFVC